MYYMDIKIIDLSAYTDALVLNFDVPVNHNLWFITVGQSSVMMHPVQVVNQSPCRQGNCIDKVLHFECSRYVQFFNIIVGLMIKARYLIQIMHSSIFEFYICYISRLEICTGIYIYSTPKLLAKV